MLLPIWTEGEESLQAEFEKALGPSLPPGGGGTVGSGFTGQPRPGHKYIHREWVSDHWEYEYQGKPHPAHHGPEHISEPTHSITVPEGITPVTHTAEQAYLLTGAGEAPPTERAGEHPPEDVSGTLRMEAPPVMDMPGEQAPEVLPAQVTSEGPKAHEIKGLTSLATVAANKALPGPLLDPTQRAQSYATQSGEFIAEHPNSKNAMIFRVIPFATGPQGVRIQAFEVTSDVTAGEPIKIGNMQQATTWAQVENWYRSAPGMTIHKNTTNDTLVSVFPDVSRVNPQADEVRKFLPSSKYKNFVVKIHADSPYFNNISDNRYTTDTLDKANKRAQLLVDNEQRVLDTPNRLSVYEQLTQGANATSILQGDSAPVEFFVPKEKQKWSHSARVKFDSEDEKRSFINELAREYADVIQLHAKVSVLNSSLKEYANDPSSPIMQTLTGMHSTNKPDQKLELNPDSTAARALEYITEHYYRGRGEVPIELRAFISSRMHSSMRKYLIDSKIEVGSLQENPMLETKQAQAAFTAPGAGAEFDDEQMAQVVGMWKQAQGGRIDAWAGQDPQKQQTAQKAKSIIEDAVTHTDHFNDVGGVLSRMGIDQSVPFSSIPSSQSSSSFSWEPAQPPVAELLAVWCNCAFDTYVANRSRLFWKSVLTISCDIKILLS